MFAILIEHHCNVDYCTLKCKRDKCIPDAFVASLTSNPMTTPVMLPYSLRCEPEYYLKFADNHGILGRVPVIVSMPLVINLWYVGNSPSEVPLSARRRKCRQSAC